MFRKFAISLYGEINKILHRLGWKLEYIGSQRYLWIKKLDITTVLDIGANKGQSVKRWSSLLSSTPIFHCFEPLSSPFAVLRSHYGHFKNVHLHNYALGSKSGSDVMYVSNIDDSSSLMPPTEMMKKTYDKIHFDTTNTIHTKTLDSIFSSLNIKGNVLMKIDTQGYELEMLKGGIASLSSIALIVVELSFTHFYQGQPLFGDVHEFLSQQGFLYYGSFEQSADPVDGKPLQQDAIFINKKYLGSS